MLPQERYDKILEILKTDGIIKINNIVEFFGVSVETARRDLAYMENMGWIERIYGGAVPVESNNVEIDFIKRSKICPVEKQAIGIKCSELINDNETVFMDTGTAVLEVARNIKNKKNLTVITNSILVANELIHSNVKVYILGGCLRESEGSFSGPLTLLGLEQFNVDKSILGAGGITLENGISDYHLEEALVRRKMIERSRKTIVVAEHLKFGVNSFASVCSIDKIDVLVTSDGISEDALLEYSNKGVHIVLSHNK